MRRRLLVTMTLLALTAAACTSAPEETARSSRQAAPSGSVLLAGAGGPLVLDVASGSVVFDAAGAVTSLGGRWLTTSSASAGDTLVETRDGSTGGVVATATVPGEFDVRIVSESGRAAALMDPLPDGWDPLVPLPRATTRIVVADPTGASEPRTFELEGNYEPEAFSSDDDRLFMIQHLPAETPRAYRVTMLDLVRGKVLPVFGPFKGPAERMPGVRLDQVLGPDADQLYTLYSSARPGYTLHAPNSGDDRIVAFVHVLSLEDGWAHCVGLPKEMWDRPASEMAMAPSPDGRYLFVVDAARGVIAIMDTESLRVRSGDVDLRVDGLRRTSAQLSADGETLYVATSAETSTITAIDVRTFDVLERWDVNGDVTGLGLSGDGEFLLAATAGDGLIVLDPATGDEVRQIAVHTPGPATRVTALGA